jgi:hypothetical protein
MTRKTASIVLFAAMLLAIIAIPAIFRSNAFAATKSAEFVIGLNKYFVNDQLPGVNMDAAPYIDSGRTLIPVRYLADALGVTDSNIQWNPVTQQVYLVQGSTTIDLAIGSTVLTVNGQASQMDVAPVIKDGRTYLPARWVADALGYQVDWNAQYKVVIIWPNGTQEPDYGNATAQAQSSNSSGGTTVSGYAIPKGSQVGAYSGSSNPGGAEPGVDIDMFVWLNGQNWNDNMAPVTESVQQQFADVQAVLAQKFDAQTVQAVMSYAAQKTSLDYNLLNKTWHANGKRIDVEGLAGSNLEIVIGNF